MRALNRFLALVLIAGSLLAFAPLAPRGGKKSAPEQHTFVSLAEAGFFAPLAQGGGDEQDLVVRITQVDTSQFPQVTVYLSVTNAAGEPVGVDPARLVLSEEGADIQAVSVRGMGEVEALTTLLVVDVSGSMNVSGKLAAAQDAARAYVAQMRPGDQAGLIAFNTQVEVVQPITAEPDEMLAAIGRLKASNDTALYDALAEAIVVLGPLTGRKAILVLTDGMDNSSTVTPEGALQGIGPGGLSISAIGLGDPAQPSGSWARLDEVVLRDLAGRAGGEYGAVADAEALRRLYERLGLALQSEYVVTYLSPSTLRDGLSRSLSVRLAEAPAGSAGEAAYNPGGLVPEVEGPAPWGVFTAALAGLVGLLLLPGLVGRGLGVLRSRKAGATPAGKARVRLQNPTKPRVKLK